MRFPDPYNRQVLIDDIRAGDERSGIVDGSIVELERLGANEAVCIGWGC